jgi:hypothetical protein
MVRQSQYDGKENLLVVILFVHLGRVVRFRAFGLLEDVFRFVDWKIRHHGRIAAEQHDPTRDRTMPRYLKRSKYKIERHEVTQPLDISYRLIPLTQGQNAIVDAADFDWLSQWNWHAQWNKFTQSFYARRIASTGVVAMHRLILGCGHGELGDHKNGHTLDNRRDNLRKCSEVENTHNAKIRKDNASRFKGVVAMSWTNKRSGKTNTIWLSAIRADNRRIYLGSFKSPEDAARAYDAAARIYHGEFAKLNFPNPDEATRPSPIPDTA